MCLWLTRPLRHTEQSTHPFGWQADVFPWVARACTCLPEPMLAAIDTSGRLNQSEFARLNGRAFAHDAG